MFDYQIKGIFILFLFWRALNCIAIYLSYKGLQKLQDIN